MDMPQDPILLMSLVNTYLRDQYDSPEALCEDRELDLHELEAKLTAAGFAYMAEINQYR